MGPLLRNLVIAVALAGAAVLALEHATTLFETRVRSGSNAGRVEAAAAPAEGWELAVAPGANGHFLLDATVNGVDLRFLVDTGASLVVIDLDQARRLGFHQGGLDFSGRVRTANGVILYAPVVLDEIVIGDLAVEDVEAAVVRRPMGTALLGMSFLGRLESYEVSDGRLVLRW